MHTDAFSGKRYQGACNLNKYYKSKDKLKYPFKLLEKWILFSEKRVRAQLQKVKDFLHGIGKFKQGKREEKNSVRLSSLSETPLK